MNVLTSALSQCSVAEGIRQRHMPYDVTFLFGVKVQDNHWSQCFISVMFPCKVAIDDDELRAVVELYTALTQRYTTKPTSFISRAQRSDTEGSE